MITQRPLIRLRTKLAILPKYIYLFDTQTINKIWGKYYQLQYFGYDYNEKYYSKYIYKTEEYSTYDNALFEMNRFKERYNDAR